MRHFVSHIASYLYLLPLARLYKLGFPVHWVRTDSQHAGASQLDLLMVCQDLIWKAMALFENLKYNRRVAKANNISNFFSLAKFAPKTKNGPKS